MLKRSLVFLALLPLLAHAANTATVTWTPATTHADGSPIIDAPTFNLYQGPSGAEVKVQSGLTSPSVVVTAGLSSGTTVCFAVTQVETATGMESAMSIHACKTFQASAPNAPTGVQVK